MSTDAPTIFGKPQPRPLALHTARPGLTYEHFYGLKEKPFSLSSDPSFFYNSSSHASAFDDLLSGIRRRESLSVVSGDIGTGKTTLCRTVLQNLDRQTFSAFVPDPFATREDLLKVVLVDFGVVSADDLSSGRLQGASRTQLSYLLYEFLATLSPLQAFAVVFIDEAQNLSLPLLEEIRILSDSDGRERQLQVVLVGQLELRDKLRLPEMRQVAQRIAVRCTLEPLDRDGVDGYVAHRLCIAGGTPDRVRFSREACDAVYNASGGVPRIINRLCDRALHYGQLRRISVIDRLTVGVAATEMDLATDPPVPPPLAAFPSESFAPAAAAASVERAAATPLIERIELVSPYKPIDFFDPIASAEPTARTEPTEPTEPAAPAAPTQRARPAAVAPTVPSMDGLESDDWFAQIDASVSAAETDTVCDVPHVPIAPQPTRSRTSAPLTHMEMLQRVWLRRLKILLVLLAIAAGSGVGLTVAVNLLTQPVGSPVVLSPVPPAMPPQIAAPSLPTGALRPSRNVPSSY